jgi:hypothetical protein
MGEGRGEVIKIFPHTHQVKGNYEGMMLFLPLDGGGVGGGEMMTPHSYQLKE